MGDTSMAFIKLDPIDGLEHVSNAIEGKILFAENGELKTTDISSVKSEISSGIKGEAITSTVPTPWVSGEPDLYEKYDVKVSGTFTNFKDSSNNSIIISSGDLNENLVQLWIKNGVSEKILKSLPKATQFIPSFISSTFPLVSTISNPIQRTEKGAIWELIPGQTALSTDVPGVSDKWVALDGNEKIIKKSIVDYAGSTFASGDIDNDGNIYLVTYTASFIGVYKNGTLVKSLTGTTYNSGLSSIAVKLKGDVIFILLGSNLATATTNGLINIQYDIVAQTFTVKPLLTTGLNEKLTCTSIVEKGSDLFCAVNIEALSNGTAWDSASVNKRIDLFKLVGEEWIKQNVIHNYNQEWDARFQKPNLVFEDSLDNVAIVPVNATLFVNERGNLGCYFSSNTNVYQYRPFSKELLNSTWQVEFITNNKGYIVYAWVDRFGKRKLFQKKYFNPTTTWTLSRNVITDLQNKSFLQITNGNEDERGMICYKNGKVIYVRVRVNVRNYVETFELSEYYINDVINVQGINNIGYATPSTVPSTNLKVGDFYIAKDVGTYQFVEYWDMTLSAFQYLYINVRLGQSVKIIWNGFGWVKEIISDSNVSIVDNTPLKSIVIYNDFGSKAFRIPVITETVKGTLILAADARRTSASDYAEMDGVICRSGDGGQTWQDYKIVFKRNMTIEGARVHDLGLTVDTNVNSPQYGRIWAFAKEWLANVDPVNLQYYVDNPDKSTFWISYSDDDGLTWSVPAERKDLYKAGAWHLSSGCAAGLTLTDGTLIQPVYWGYSTADFRSGFLKKSVGGDWQIGNEIPSSFGNTNENSIVQDLDGKIIMNARASSLVRKVFELTTITGSWINRPDLEVFQDIIGGCQNSFFRYRNTYLYIQPTPNGTATRNNIRLYYSFDKINWQKMIDLTGSDVSGGYSSLVVSDRNFSVVFEKNINNVGGISHVGLNYLRNLLR